MENAHGDTAIKSFLVSQTLSYSNFQILGTFRRNARDRECKGVKMKRSVFDVRHAAWYRLVAYALQNLPVPHDDDHDPQSPPDTGYGRLDREGSVQELRELTHRL